MTNFEPDARWAHIIGDLHAAGGPRLIEAADLKRVADGWPVTGHAPEGVNRLLETARTLWGLAWFEYDLMTVSASWSLLAVEAVLAERLDGGRKANFGDLIKKAQAEDLLDDQWADRLDAGRQLRNGLMHARKQSVWSLGMASPIVGASHEVVALLYPEAA